jgi:hypothetical protein
MSDHARVAGKTSQTIELGGKTYTLKPYVVGLWAEMSAFVRTLKGDPIKEVCDRLDSIPADQQQRWMRAAVEAAANQTPSEQELASFEGSLLGTAFKLWATLKADHGQEFPHPQAVMDRLISLTEEQGEKKLAEIMMKLEVASGEYDLKNSAGQPATPA